MDVVIECGLDPLTVDFFNQKGKVIEFDDFSNFVKEYVKDVEEF